MYNVNELLNNMTEAEIIEFLEKVPVEITTDVDITAGFFGKAWGKVKVTITYKDKVIQHQEKLL